MGPRTHGNWWKLNSWSISQIRFLISTHRTSAYTWYICKGCQGSYQELDRQDTWGTLEVQRQATSFLKKTLCRKIRELLNLSRNQLRKLKGLATGHCYLTQHLFKPGLVQSPCVIDASRHLKWPHTFFVVVRIWPTESSLYETGWHWRQVSRILHFVQIVGQLNERAKGLHKRSIMVEVCSSLWSLPFHTLF